MAFVNEYMSQEDIAKYRFEGLVQQYVTFAGRETFLMKPHWTVDKERVGCVGFATHLIRT